MTWSYGFCCPTTATAACEPAKYAPRKKKDYSTNKKTIDLTYLVSKYSFRQKNRKHC